MEDDDAGLICTATYAGRLVYPAALVADRWCVVWGPDRREAYFRDRALAEAYAAAHRGVLVPMAALVAWPDCSKIDGSASA